MKPPFVLSGETNLFSKGTIQQNAVYGVTKCETLFFITFIFTLDKIRLTSVIISTFDRNFKTVNQLFQFYNVKN